MSRTYRVGPRTSRPGTPLDAALIVAPTDEVYRSLVADLNAAVRSVVGRDLPVCAPKEVMEPGGLRVNEEGRSRPLILMGDINQNRALLPLYARLYDACDARYPGGDGYVLRTVVNPWGTGHNGVIAGGSTAEGVRRAVTRLAEVVRQGSVPLLLEVAPEEALRQRFEADAAALTPAGRPDAIVHAYIYGFMIDAIKYTWTGIRAYGERARDALFYLNERFDGRYHPDQITNEDYGLEAFARGWDLIGDSGLFTAEQVRETDQNMLLTADADWGKWWRPDSRVIGSRHTTSGAMSYYELLHTLLTKCSLTPEDRARLEERMEGFRRYMRLACSSFRDDNDHLYSFDSAENACRYALESGDTTFFDNGMADLAIRRGVMHLSNAGFYAGVGGYGEAFPGQMWVAPVFGPLLQMAAYVKRDGRCRWISEHLPGTDKAWRPFTLFGIHTFAMGEEVAGVAPTDLLGVTTLPLSAYTYRMATSPDLLPGHTPRAVDRGRRPGRATVAVTTLPHERTVEKVCFREGFGPDDQYLLLNTFIGSAHNTADANAVSHFLERGKLFLFHNTGVTGMYTKNAVYVSDGQDKDPIPCACERVAVADLPGFGFSATELAPYRGTAWRRTILWRRGEYFVALDRVRALRAGSYACQATWRSFYKANLEGRVWRAEADGDTFYLKGGADRPSVAEHAGLEGAARPHVLRQSSPLLADAQAGDVDGFHNLIYLSGRGRERDLEIETISPFAAVVRGRDRRGAAPILYGCESGGGEALPGGLRAEAEAFAVSEAEVALVAGRRVGVGDEAFLDLSAPSDVELDLGAGRGTVVVSTETKVTSGRLGISVTLPAGRHEITFQPTAIQGLSKTLCERQVRSPKVEGRSPKNPSLNLSPVWRYEGLVPEDGPAEGISVSVNRPPEGRRPLRLLSEPQHPGDSMTWPAGGPVTVTLRLPRPMAVTRIVFRRSRTARSYRETNLAAMSGVQAGAVSGPLTFDLSILKEGGGERSGPARVTLDPAQSSPVYGGEPWYFLEGTLPVGEERVREVRLTFSGEGPLTLGSFTVCAKGSDAGKPVRAHVADVDGDGQAEFLLYHGDKGRRLALVDHDGRELWQRGYASDITVASSADLEGDGRHTLLVLTAEEKLYAHRLDGGRAFETVFAGLREQTKGDGFFYGEMPWGIAPFRADASGKRGLVVGHYCFASFLDGAGRVYDYAWVNGTYVSDPITDGIDWDGDGGMDVFFRQRMAWQGDVPLEAFDGGTRRAIAHSHGIGGFSLLNRVLDWDGDGRVEIVTAADQGASCFEGDATRWIYRSPCPVRGAALCGADGGLELVLARRDGHVVGLTADGKDRPLHSVFEEIVGFAALDRGLRYVVALRTGLCVYDREWRAVGRLACPVRRIEAVPGAEGDRLLIQAPDGRVELVSV